MGDRDEKPFCSKREGDPKVSSDVQIRREVSYGKHSCVCHGRRESGSASLGPQKCQLRLRDY